MLISELMHERWRLTNGLTVHADMMRTHAYMIYGTDDDTHHPVARCITTDTQRSHARTDDTKAILMIPTASWLTMHTIRLTYMAVQCLLV